MVFPYLCFYCYDYLLLVQIAHILNLCEGATLHLVLNSVMEDGKKSESFVILSSVILLLPTKSNYPKKWHCHEAEMGC